MKKLNRGNAPTCLNQYQHGRNNWSDVSSGHKTEIWTQLIQMQGERCAYCECSISRPNCHIEHFVQKGRVPQETFNWDNLFGSCNISGTCGKLKDNVGRYDHHQVVKPDIDHPDEYLLYINDGTIVPAKGLSAAQQGKAEQTLGVLGLHHSGGQLREMRRYAIAGYIQTAEGIAEFAIDDPDDTCGWRQELENELTIISDHPFSTSIRHMFRSYIGF